MKKYQQLKDLVNMIEEDFVKFYEKDNNAAGTRCRKAMQELKNLAQDIRKDIQDRKKRKLVSLNPRFIAKKRCLNLEAALFYGNASRILASSPGEAATRGRRTALWQSCSKSIAHLTPTGLPSTKLSRIASCRR